MDHISQLRSDEERERGRRVLILYYIPCYYSALHTPHLANMYVRTRTLVHNLCTGTRQAIVNSFVENSTLEYFLFRTLQAYVH